MQLQSILDKHPRSEDQLIEILLEYQATKDDHCISQEEILLISKHLNISESKVCSVISFYSFFSFVPRGKYVIQLCKDIPCFLNNSGNILKVLENLLGITVGETTPNRLFTLELTSCLGCCDKPPAMRIDGKTYTNLNPDKIKVIISEYSGKQL